ncbi:MAG TPA: RNA 2',3'-cyclic phosphodiesterase [Acidimicrobiales bacterium]|jgi:2'-5' RNA ligase|nr:RNA 2',3'-cyclic phosphodiesterase [Acidimicrobiales bacterium]
MRLFVGVRPPDDVLDLIADLPRRAQTGLRWTTREQWHVTLRFLGEVADPTAVVEALDGADPARLVACEATVGPVVETLSRQVVALPVAGLDDLAMAVVEATGTLGRPPEDRPFHGHITLARLARSARGSARRLTGEIVGRPLSARFAVSDVRVVRSHLGRAGARYEDVYVRHLG